MISVAMTTYNGEKYLREQLDSILNQTYKDIELVICDDCSKDGTREILKEYEKKDSRVKIYFNEQNLGFKKNFEKAISLCKGDYVALSDQDDVWLPNHLEHLQSIIDDADIACADAQLMDSNGDSLNSTLSKTDEFYFFENSPKMLYRVLGKGNCFQGASMLIKRTFFDNALPIPEKVLYHDAWFTACAFCGKGVNYSFEIITKYRQHDSQITYSSHQDKTTVYLIKQFFSDFLKKYTTDRLFYIEELRERYNLSEGTKKIIDDCWDINLIRTRQICFFKRLKKSKILFLNYEYIYTRKDNKYKTIRILKNIF